MMPDGIDDSEDILQEPESTGGETVEDFPDEAEDE